jgi:lipopolysaccharide export system protein LptA
MEADKLGDTVTFIDEVVLKKEAMTLNADRLVVHYDPPTKGVREIEALGKVIVTQEGRVAMGEKAIYYSREERLVLTGDARIVENENQLGGERIILFLRENRSVVEGGKVLFYQDKTAEGKAKSPLLKAR